MSKRYYSFTLKYINNFIFYTLRTIIKSPSLLSLHEKVTNCHQTYTMLMEAVIVYPTIMHTKLVYWAKAQNLVCTSPISKSNKFCFITLALTIIYHPHCTCLPKLDLTASMYV